MNLPPSSSNLSLTSIPTISSSSLAQNDEDFLQYGGGGGGDNQKNNYQDDLASSSSGDESELCSGLNTRASLNDSIQAPLTSRRIASVTNIIDDESPDVVLHTSVSEDSFLRSSLTSSRPKVPTRETSSLMNSIDDFNSITSQMYNVNSSIPDIKLKSPRSTTAVLKNPTPPMPIDLQQQQQQVLNRPTYKGNLLFDSSFESGNLEKVIRVDENEYDLYVRGDTYNPGKRMWYYFKVSNVLKNQKVLFTITNLSKNKSLYRQGMTPLVSSTSRPKWERIPEKQVYYYRKPAKYANIATAPNLLSFVFVFDRDEDEYYFSYCYPYTYTELQKFLFVIESKNFNYFHRSELCKTAQNRRCDILTIASPSLLADTTIKKKKIVFITSRVHPGETPASFVCHGFISFICSNHPVAVQLREKLIFKIVPMLNPDGVAIGNYRTCSMGFDLNRHWLSPQEWSQPTIYHVRKYLLELRNDPNYQIDFFMDLHSHSAANNGFMYVNYGNKPNSSTMDSDQLRFPKLLDYRAKEFSMSDTKRCKDPSKLGASRRVLGEVLNVAKYCYTLEVSFFSYKSSAESTKMSPFTMENYCNLGKNMCMALADFYGLDTASIVIPSAQESKD